MVSDGEFESRGLTATGISCDKLQPLWPVSSQIPLTIGRNIPFSVSILLRSNLPGKYADSAIYQPEDRLSNLADPGMEMVKKAPLWCIKINKNNNIAFPCRIGYDPEVLWFSCQVK